MSRCEQCKFRQAYDNNPRSRLGGNWKWHTGWCPGWKSYMIALPDGKSPVIWRQIGLDRQHMFLCNLRFSGGNCGGKDRLGIGRLTASSWILNGNDVVGAIATPFCLDQG